MTVDPDGLPARLLGSRDNYYRVLAIDRPQADRAVEARRRRGVADDVERRLGRLARWSSTTTSSRAARTASSTSSSSTACARRRRAGAGRPQARVQHARLGRRAAGRVNVGQNDVSIENSVAICGRRVYFANSGGLVQGWDIERARRTGVDADPRLPVLDRRRHRRLDRRRRARVSSTSASSTSAATSRAAEVGQMLKLDPSAPTTRWCGPSRTSGTAGVWTTPALHDDLVVAATDGGTVSASTATPARSAGRCACPPPTWQSPVIVDDTLIQGDCDGRAPRLRRVRHVVRPAGAVVGPARRAASSRRRRSGRAASTSGPGAGGSMPSVMAERPPILDA